MILVRHLENMGVAIARLTKFPTHTVVFLAIVLGFLGFAVNADATNYYVRKNGSDANNCTAASTACLTIQAAENIVDNDLDGTGDVIYVGAGTYYETVTASIGGSDGNNFQFVADTSGIQTGDVGTVIVKAVTSGFTAAAKSYITIDGFHITGGSTDGVALANSGSSDGVGWVIKNVVISNMGSDGIQGDGYESITVQDSVIYGNAGNGIRGTNDGTADYADSWTIQRNKVYGNGADGIVFPSTTGSIPDFLITDNTVYGNATDGISLGGAAASADFAVIRENQIWGNGDDGFVVQGAAANMVVRSNLIYDNVGDGISLEFGGTGTQHPNNSQFSNNTIYNNGANGYLGSTSGTDPAVPNRLYNNIIAGNRSNGISADADRVTISYNDVVNNRLENYSTVSPGTGDISTNPFFTASSTDSTGTFSFDFDNSNDLVSIADNAALELASTITVEAWIKPDTLAANDGIVDRWANAGNRVWSMARGSGTNGVGVMVSSNGGNATCNATSTAVMVASRWNHVSFSLDGSQLYIGVNGHVQSFPCTSAIYTGGTSTIEIGGNRVGSFFDGMIDEVRVSSFPLYAASTTSGTATSTPARFMSVATSTIGLWHFNAASTTAGENQIVRDSGPNGMDGTRGADSSVGTDDPGIINTGPDFGAFLRTATSTSGVDSPAINGGSLNSWQNGVASSTTRIDGVLDLTDSLVDWGYHYASSTIAQNSFRFYDTLDAITPTSASAATNTAITNFANAANTRLRMNAVFYSDSTTTQEALHGATFKLQYGQNATCSSVASWTDVGAVGSGTIWRGYNNTSASDGRTIPSSLLTSSLLETYQENAATTTPSPLVAGAPAEWDWTLENNGATGGTDYCFRMAHNNASTTALASYRNYPKITTAAAAASDLQQIHYRWRSDTVSETDAGAWLAAEDTSASVQKHAPARLRVEVSNEGSSASGQTRFRLEYGTLSTSCADISSWAPVGNAGSSTPTWSMSPSAILENNASTTNFSGSLTDENGTFLAGVFKDTDADTTGMVLSGDPATGHFTEHEFSIVSSLAVAPGTNYCYRLTDAGNSSGLTYTVYPQLSIAAPISSGGGGGGTSDSTPSAGTVTGGTGQGGGGGGESESPPPPPAQGGGGGGGGGGGESGFWWYIPPGAWWMASAFSDPPNALPSTYFRILAPSGDVALYPSFLVIHK